MDLYLKILVGVGLSAASGFRIFIPFFILSIYSFLGIDILNSGLFIFSSNSFLIIFLILSVAEVILYYNPWIDNLLDLITTPASIFSGTILVYVLMADTEIFIRLPVSIILGGGAALNIQLLTVKARSLTSVFTSGYGNQIVSTIENISSVFIAVLMLNYPSAGILFTIIIIIMIYVLIIKRGYRKENRNFLKSA